MLEQQCGFDGIDMKRIYLDHASSMPIDPRVLKFAMPFLNKNYENPSSIYSGGLETKRAIEESRRKIAELVNAENTNNIIFTSSATESNNLAIKGTALRNIGNGKNILASAIEHISVLNPMKELQKNGYAFDIIPVDSNGLVDLDRLENLLTNQTIITSIMYANNEIGTIEPIKKISKIVHENGKYLHVDATASAGRIPIDVQDQEIDLLTISSNDMYGPRGASALYVKQGLKIQSILPGGGQERGIRSGTENVFAIVGMGEAARLAKNDMNMESSRLKNIRDKLIHEILKIDNAYLTGHPVKRLPHHVSFRFRTGSACSSKTLEPSHVLLAIGLKHEEAHGSMVITLGKSNNLELVPDIVKVVKETVNRLRKLSPLSNLR